MGDLARAHICLGATIPNIWSVSHQHLSGYPCLQTVIITKIYEMDQDSKYRNKKAQPSFPHLTLATIVKICNILETTEIDCGIDPQDLWDRPKFKISRQKCNIYIFIRNILETTEIDWGIDPHRQSVLLSRHSYTTHNIIAALEFLVNASGAPWTFGGTWDPNCRKMYDVNCLLLVLAQI